LAAGSASTRAFIHRRTHMDSHTDTHTRFCPLRLPHGRDAGACSLSYRSALVEDPAV
jgi:hypothetical protein